ncbi:MAG: hypothetical protein WDN31_10970 [Hyphomicrobium sp.]
MPTPKPNMSEADFVRRVLIVLAIGAAAAVLYLLSDILLLIFGAVLVAVVLRSIARPLEQATSLGPQLSLAVAGLGLAALIVGVGMLFGAQIKDQLALLLERLPAATANLSKSQPFQSVSDILKGSSIGNLLSNALSWGTTLFGGLASFSWCSSPASTSPSTRAPIVTAC